MKRVVNGNRLALWFATVSFAAATLGSACGNDDSSGTGAGGSAGADVDDASTAGGSAGVGPDPDGHAGASMDESSLDRDGAERDVRRNCAALIVGRPQPKPPSGVCTLDAAVQFTTYACLPPPSEGTTCEDTYDEPCVLDTYMCGGLRRGTSIVCGPVFDDSGNCCYLTSGGCPPD